MAASLGTALSCFGKIPEPRDVVGALSLEQRVHVSPCLSERWRVAAPREPLAVHLEAGAHHDFLAVSARTLRPRREGIVEVAREDVVEARFVRAPEAELERDDRDGAVCVDRGDRLVRKVEMAERAVEHHEVGGGREGLEGGVE